MKDRKMEKEKAIEIMRRLEPCFMRAGDLACNLQSKAKVSNKIQGLSPEISIVTDIDLLVQEQVLETIIQTDLIECNILAEEDTQSVSKFKNKSDLFLTIDPIDGTLNYAGGKPFFAIIVGLRTTSELLYTFYHFPRFQWTQIMIGDTYQSMGNPPDGLNLPERLSESIIYSFGDNLIGESDPVVGIIKEKGLQVISKKELSPDLFIGSTALFTAGYSAGIYVPNPLCVDGLVGLHYAQTKNLPVFANGPNGEFDLSLIVDNPSGRYHPGYYLSMNR